MRRMLGPITLACLLGGVLPGQTTKKTNAPIPPALNEPGVVQPKPIPEQDPAAPPNVQQPVHETGREKAVSSRNRSSKRGTRPKQAVDRTQTQTTPETSPKVEQNGQVGGAQDPTRRKATEKAPSPAQP